MASKELLELKNKMELIGDMCSYAIRDLKLDADTFFSKFISSGMAAKIECSTKTISSISGTALAEIVLDICGIKFSSKHTTYRSCNCAEYWAGWALTYYQFTCGDSFKYLTENGLSLSAVIDLYDECSDNLATFTDKADDIVNKRSGFTGISKLEMWRKKNNLTQQELGILSGVPVYTIKLLELGGEDLMDTRLSVAVSLVDALGCYIEDLLD